MSTLKCTYIQQASSASPNITLDSSTNATVAGTLAMGHSFKRNKIINGDMRIDQRNAGASVNATSSFPYTLDRWGAYCNTATKFTVQQNAGSITPAVGYTNYLGCTSTSAYTLGSGDQMLVAHRVEGFNIADLGWGTANAKSITISFWVYSSLTGTFGGSLQNNGASWCYPFSYTISQASVWEQKTITIAGPNASQGTWLTNNGIGIVLNFSLGTGATYSGTAGSWVNTSFITSVTGAVSVVGTNGATFYITGVQLETGSIATPYERQIYSDQLAQCQRYYYRATSSAGYTSFGYGWNTSTSAGNCVVNTPTMRVAPTAIDYSTLGSSVPGVSTGAISSASIGQSGINATTIAISSSATFATGFMVLTGNNSTSAYIGFNAEL